MDLLELRVVPQFRLVREGGAGRWKYNAGDLSIGFAGLDDSWLVESEEWVIREVPRFVNRVALTKYIRSNLSQRDWDAFIEIYGIPGGIVIGPPDVPPDRERDYAVAAESAATSGHAYLPHGSSYAANDGPRGTNPFAEHMRFLSEQLVLAGTGGKLTMLAESGSGTLAGGAHLETFRRIARGEARRIGEIIQRQVVAPFLEERFPGAEEMAYFEMAFREEVDSAQIVEDVVKLAGAGYQMDADELSEKTGYQLAMDGQDTERNRSDADLEEMLQEVAEADDEELEDALAVLNREFPEVGAALRNGGFNPLQPRNDDGEWISGEELRGTRAVKRALQEKRDAISAMTHPEFGPIDLPYVGHGGKGLKKIVEDHGMEAALKAPHIIMRGRPLAPAGNNQPIVKDGWRAILTKTEGRDKRHWLLSSYDKEKKEVGR